MALTAEQQLALDELMSLVPSPSAAVLKTPPDMLKTWLGISSEDAEKTLQALLMQKDGYQRQLLDWIERNPLDTTFEFTGICAWAFYQAEKGANPKIETFMDAFYYIASCASVGYADIFAVTQAGRAIAGLVMLVGPALTNMTLNRPKTED